jgi:hypothetical protein
VCAAQTGRPTPTRWSREAQGNDWSGIS